MIELKIQIDGMKCGMCETHVNDAIRRAAKIKKVKSSHKTGLATIILESNDEIIKILDSIKNQGYKVINYEINNYEKKGFFK